MSDEEDKEIHRIAEKQSRFSRYRDQIRQRKQLDLMEMMATDDLNEASYVARIFFSCFRDDM